MVFSLNEKEIEISRVIENINYTVEARIFVDFKGTHI